MIVKTDNINYVKNTSNGALINTNRNSLEAHKARKREVQRISNLEEQMDILNDKMDDIYNILVELKK